jgi:hypothetical protein
MSNNGKRHVSTGRERLAPAEQRRWRASRARAVCVFMSRIEAMPWSASLLRALIEELYVDEEFAAMCGRPEKIRPDAYPQAIAVALALRHSWQRDDFTRLVKRLTNRRGSTGPPGGARS